MKHLADSLPWTSVFVPAILNMSVLYENVDYSSFLSLCSERSEVSGCTQRSPRHWARSVLYLCFRGSVVFDALREGVLQCLRVDVNAVGYKEEVEKFGHDERDVNSRVCVVIQRKRVLTTML